MLKLMWIAELIICAELLRIGGNSVGKMATFVSIPQNIFCVISVQSERTLMVFWITDTNLMNSS